MKRLLVVLAFATATAHAHELAGTECQAATESTGQITERRNQGYSRQDLKDNIDHWKASYGRLEIAGLLKDIVDWVYAEPDKSPIEMATRFWHACSRSGGQLARLPLIPTDAAPDVFECMTIVDMSRHIKHDLKSGRPLDNVLVEIWTTQDEDDSLVAVSALADLAKLIYADPGQVPEAHAMRYLKTCLDKADRTASTR